MDIEEILDRIYFLPEQSKVRLAKAVAEVSYPKNFVLMEGNKVVPYVYFIKKGIVRAYAATEDRDITFWFGKEGDPVVSMKSYVEDRPGYEHIELLEDCSLYRIETYRLKKLYEDDIHMANWGRRFAEKELVKTEEMILSRQFKTAAECYRDLMQDKPDLLQRVQLGHIASYLGISQVTLSRIRAEMK